MEFFTKIAFYADEEMTLNRALHVIESERCTDVYLVGANNVRKAELERKGLNVHTVQNKDDLPADVFLWLAHESFWASSRIDNGAIRDVAYAHDNLMAAKLLLSQFAPALRKQYCVRPVEVKTLPGFAELLRT